MNLVAIVGRPNVGKSTLFNRIVGGKEAIVENVPGVTRDRIYGESDWNGKSFMLVDTGGFVPGSENTMERAIREQANIAIEEADANRKGIIIALNKWDLVEKDSKTADEFTEKFREQMRSYDYVPLTFISALTKQRITKVVELAKEIKKTRETRISTAQLNKMLLPEFDKIPPPSVQGRDLRINFVTQVKTEPPIFAFFCNFPELIPDSYKRYMENKLRSFYPFAGTPISFIFRRKNVKWEEYKENK